MIKLINNREKRISLWLGLSIVLFLPACNQLDDDELLIQERIEIENYAQRNGLEGAFLTNGVFISISDSGITDTSQNNPTQFDTVQLICTARLLNGTEIYSSNGQFLQNNDGSFPTLFELADGLNQGLQNFQRQSTGVIISPSSLAYGRSGNGEDVPPDSPIVFEVELQDF